MIKSININLIVEIIKSKDNENNKQSMLDMYFVQNQITWTDVLNLDKGGYYLNLFLPYMDKSFVEKNKITILKLCSEKTKEVYDMIVPFFKKMTKEEELILINKMIELKLINDKDNENNEILIKYICTEENGKNPLFSMFKFKNLNILKNNFDFIKDSNGYKYVIKSLLKDKKIKR